MQPLLPALLRVLDALLQDPLGLLDELPVQVDGIGVDAAGCVVLAEDEVRGLLVVRFHLDGVLLALLGQLVGRRAIASLVCLVRLRKGVVC
jgi:hypothetical protein